MDHINTVTPKEVKTLMEEDKDVVIVDVREDEEVAQGIIKDAKHIPLDEVPHSTNELDKNKHYIFVCHSGRRSMTAASFMDERGFNVSSLEGGMKGWDGETIG